MLLIVVSCGCWYRLAMGMRNYLIEGVSGAGKTTVAEELQRRGYHVLHGDRELVYRGDPKTGKPVNEPVHESERDKAVWQRFVELQLLLESLSAK